MLGKRKTTMRRTSSVSLIGAGSGNGDSSPVPEHPKEKLKSSNYPSPGCAAPRQVIGFHPKAGFIDEEELPSSPISPHRAVSSSPRSSCSSGKSPSGSPRSGLGDLLAGSRPWERKDEGVGLGIVAALSGSQEEVCSKELQEDGARGYGSRRTSPPPHAHAPSVFAPSRASPPIPIHHPPHHSNSGRHSPSHCADQNCCPAVALGLAPPSFRPQVSFDVSSVHQNGGSRPNPSAVANGGPWTRPTGHHNGGGGGGASNWSHHSHNEHMEVDVNELYAIASPYPAHLVRHPNAGSSSGFRQNFLDACHLCKRRLDEGRDIYMYRGDRAFCSPECRHQQILNDERLEKCSAAVMKVGGGSDVRSTTQRSRVMAAGTATAAAA